MYYPDAFTENDYKNWIKKVENYLDSRTGKSGVPLSYVIRPANADPAHAPDEYTCAMWAASFATTVRTIVMFIISSRIYKPRRRGKHGLRKFATVTLLRQTCSSANTLLVRLTSCAVQPVLMRNLNSYSGKVRRRFRSKNSNPFEHRLSRIASSRFTNIEPGRHKRSIGAVTSNSSSRSHGRGSGGGRH